MEQKKILSARLNNNAVIFQPGEGEILELKGSTITFKVTSKISNNQLGLYEIKLAPGTIGAQYHFHREMDETFIVNEGIMTIQLDNKSIEARAGTVIYVPRLTPHGFANYSAENASVTLIFKPSFGREGFFIDLMDILKAQPVDPARFLKLYNDYDSFPVDVNNMIPEKQVS